MRRFAFILASFFASCVGHKSTSKDSAILSTANPDTKRVLVQDSLPGAASPIDFNGKKFGYGIPATPAIYETLASNGVIIQNSLPKGGGYIDPAGKNFGYRIFWARVVNESGSPLELTVSFPADSFAILPWPESYLKLFLPRDTMTLDKIILYDYGASGLKSFLDTDFNKPTALRRTLNPKDEALFYIAVLFYQAQGITRAGLVMKEQTLFYRISLLPEVNSMLIPCGQIVSKE